MCTDSNGDRIGWARIDTHFPSIHFGDDIPEEDLTLKFGDLDSQDARIEGGENIFKQVVGGNWDSVKDYMHFEFNGLAPK